MAHSNTQQHLENLINTLRTQGIQDNRVLNALRKVPREKFLPPSAHFDAYENTALPIDCAQTISQPYIVAHMTQLLLQAPKLNKVLEIGTGSGYQAAILCQLAKEVYTIERIEQLYKQSKNLLTQLHYNNIHFRYGDGNLGWPQAAPFDGIIVTACAPRIPQALLEQLSAHQGRLIIPVGETKSQNLVLITRNGDNYEEQIIEPVRFVPLKSGLE